MKAILADIQSGEFAREWVEDMDNNEARLKEMRAEAAQSQLETVGKELRGADAQGRGEVEPPWRPSTFP